MNPPTKIEVSSVELDPMPSEIGYDDVKEWLDESVLEEVEQRPTRDAQFRFLVRVSGYDLTVYKERREGPLWVGITMQFPAGSLSTLITRDADRRHLTSLFSSVLTNISGAYSPLDGDEEPTTFEQMEALAINSLIYPDGAGQDRLMNQIMEVGTAAAFVNDMIEMFDDNLQDQA